MEQQPELESAVKRLQRENTRLQALLAPNPTAATTTTSAAISSASAADATEGALSIVVAGVSGDLSKKKILQSLFHLFTNHLLPPRTTVCGYARTKWSRQEFEEFLRKYIKPHERLEEFISLCIYVSGQYDSVEDMAHLNDELKKVEEERGGPKANRLFYFSIPPFAFAGCCGAIAHSAMSATGWNRMVLEKPFGSDSDSYAALSQSLRVLFKEEQMFRIDHYLGKEMVQNLMALRFANAVFEPIWSNASISSVQIVFKEDIGTDGRGGYFDKYGILRDVMQNHLLQILALVAMEAPVSASAEDVRDEKVKVLKCVRAINLDDVVLGQYVKSDKGPGYKDDETVPRESQTPTYGAVVMYVDNRRWSGVPFILRCGKALDDRKAEIRLQFKPVPGRLFHGAAQNELVMRVQPDEAVYMKITSKVPGLSKDFEIAQTELDLTYKARYKDTRLPDAYERLILDVVRGDHSLFVRHDELAVAWNLFTPLLHAIEKGHKAVVDYPRGSRGPQQAEDLVSRYYTRTDGYEWNAGASRL